MLRETVGMGVSNEAEDEPGTLLHKDFLLTKYCKKNFNLSRRLKANFQFNTN